MPSVTSTLPRVRAQLAGRDTEILAWTLALVAATADVASTAFGLQAGLSEGNPVAEWVLVTTGVGGFVALKVVVVLVVGTLGLWCFERRTVAPLVLAVTWGVVAFVNVIVILLG